MISSVDFSASALNAPPVTPATVLVVDDDPISLLLAGRILEKSGYRVLMAHTPEQAIDMFERYSEPIDMLVTDVQMPEMNGYDLAKALQRRNPGLPVLFMTALDNEGYQRRRTVLSKPFTFVGLLQSVSATLHSNQKIAPIWGSC